MILKNDKIEFKALTRNRTLTFSSFSQARDWALTQTDTVWIDLIASQPDTSLKVPIAKVSKGRIEMIHAFYLSQIDEVYL